MDASIAIVEDERELIDIYQETIKQSLPDVHIVSFDNGKDAIDKLKSKRVDLVLLDIALPDVDGVQVATQLRKSSANSESLIHVISGHVDDKVIGAANDIGGIEIYQKPMDPDDLSKNVYDALQSRVNLHYDLRLLMTLKEATRSLLTHYFGETPLVGRAQLKPINKKKKILRLQ